MQLQSKYEIKSITHPEWGAIRCGMIDILSVFLKDDIVRVLTDNYGVRHVDELITPDFEIELNSDTGTEVYITEEGVAELAMNNGFSHEDEFPACLLRENACKVFDHLCMDQTDDGRLKIFKQLDFFFEKYAHLIVESRALEDLWMASQEDAILLEHHVSVLEATIRELEEHVQIYEKVLGGLETDELEGNIVA